MLVNYDMSSIYIQRLYCVQLGCGLHEWVASLPIQIYPWVKIRVQKSITLYCNYIKNQVAIFLCYDDGEYSNILECH